MLCTLVLCFLNFANCKMHQGQHTGDKHAKPRFVVKNLFAQNAERSAMLQKSRATVEPLLVPLDLADHREHVKNFHNNTFLTSKRGTPQSSMSCTSELNYVWLHLSHSGLNMCIYHVLPKQFQKGLSNYLCQHCGSASSFS